MLMKRLIRKKKSQRQGPRGRNSKCESAYIPTYIYTLLYIVRNGIKSGDKRFFFRSRVVVAVWNIYGRGAGRRVVSCILKIVRCNPEERRRDRLKSIVEATGYKFGVRLLSKSACRRMQLTHDMHHIFCPSLQLPSNVPPLLDTSRIGTLRHFFPAASLLRRVYYNYPGPLLQIIHYTRVLRCRNCSSHCFHCSEHQKKMKRHCPHCVVTNFFTDVRSVRVFSVAASCSFVLPSVRPVFAPFFPPETEFRMRY